MKLVSFARAGAIGYGVHLGDAILDLRLAAALAGDPALPPDMIGFIATGATGLATARRLLAATGVVEAARVSASEVRLLAPIPRPAKNVFCVGRNYVDHVAEGYRARGTETKLPEFPQFFTKPPTAVIGPDETFTHDPNLTQMLDYEVELAVVIGTRGRDIPAARALEHVYGFTIANDITARDLQRRHDQWFKGKGLDRSCPLGPWIVTADEIQDYRDIELSLFVNGERRQNAKGSQMIFDIPTIIASLSAGMTLEPGDVIATGTPSGVGYAMTPPHPLKAGDEVVCEIASIGRLVTRIVGA